MWGGGLPLVHRPLQGTCEMKQLWPGRQGRGEGPSWRGWGNTDFHVWAGANRAAGQEGLQPGGQWP